MNPAGLASAPAGRAWTASIDPLRASAAMILILGAALCGLSLPTAGGAAASSVKIALAELAGSSAAFVWLRRSAGVKRGWDLVSAAPLRLRDLRIVAAAPPLIWIGCAVLGWCWGGVLEKLGIPFEKEQTLIALVPRVSTAEFLLLVLAVGVITPVAEEFFFRRLLYGLLEPTGRLRATLATAAIFSAAHGFLYGLPGFFWMGIVFQFVYCRCRNLIAPAAVHLIVNCVALVATRAGI